MVLFALRRMTSAVLVLFAISVLVFVIFFATPGIDPAARIAGRNADQATLAQVRHSFGLDRPLPVRYGLLMEHLFITRDLESFVNRGNRVIPQIVQATPITLSPARSGAMMKRRLRMYGRSRYSGLAGGKRRRSSSLSTASRRRVWNTW